MKLKGKIIVFLIALLLLMSFTTVCAEGTNLLQNPGFEEGSPDDVYFWIKQAWQKDANASEFKIDETQKHSGSKSVYIVNNVANDSRFKQEIKAKPNTYYKILGWIKTENVGKDNKGANISVENLLETSKDLRETNEDWELVELYGKTGEGQQSFMLTLGLGGYGSLNTGKAWFDDITVEELSSLPADRNAINLFQGSNTSTGKTSKGPNVVLIIIAILAAAFIGALVYFMIKSRKLGTDRGGSDKGEIEPVATINESLWLKLTKIDILLMVVMTLIYTVIALYNLGSTNVPKTEWKPASPGENFVVDLGKEVDVSRIYYYGAFGEGKYRVQYKDNTGNFVPLTTIEKKDVFIWKFINVTAKTSQLKVIVDNPGAILGELAIFEKESKIPLTGMKIVEKKLDNGDKGTVENLFDEPGTVEYRPTFMTGTYFDEIYHVRTAYEHIHKIEPYETTHPPLGKIFIAFGIMLFGMNPFGWRIAGTLFGAAMIPVMYIFGKKMFGKTFYAFCTAFLIMFDFMHFTQTRIGTIDTYGAFFVILMYYYMYDYYMHKSYLLGFRKSLKPLFLSGLFFGIGSASKWVCIYGGAGLALLLFLAKWEEYKDYEKVAHKKTKRPAWVNDFFPLYINGTALYCVLFFIVIPSIIYLCSYIPFMMVPGPGHGISDVITYQAHMYNYHSKLVATHSFSSPWYEWPIIYKPMWFYGGENLPAGKAESIVSMGNPAIWWVGLIAVIAAIFIALDKKDKKMVVIFAAGAFQFVPWMIVSRIVFIYHFFSTVPFMIIAIVYVIKYIMEKYPQAKYSVYAYLGIVAILFVMFYPIMSGALVDRSYVEHYLRWFDNWIFM